MIPQYELRAEDIRRYTIEKMKEHFSVKAHGYCCTTDMILDVLLKASRSAAAWRRAAPIWRRLQTATRSANI